MAAAPVAARVAGNELADPLRNYGHLLIRASLFACERLDGRFVINRATMTPIGFSWEQGLKQAVASGTPPELLLAVPALPALLTWARPIGVLADPQRRPEVRRLLAFAVAIELARRRIETRLVVREEQSGYCFFDRILLCGKSSLERYAGLDDGDWGPCANNDRSRAMRAVLLPPVRAFADGGDTSAADAPTATAAKGDETPAPTTDFPLARMPDQADSTLTAIDPAADGVSGSHEDVDSSLPWPDVSDADLRAFYSLGKWSINRALTAAANEGQTLAEDEIRTSPFSYNSSGKLIQGARDQLDRPSVAAQINNAMYGTADPQPSNAVERYLGRVAGGFGANPVMGAIFPWVTTAGELLGEGASDFNKAWGSPLAEWQARLLGNVVGGVGGVPAVARSLGQGARAIGNGIADSVQGLVPRARSWLGEAAQGFPGARLQSAGTPADPMPGKQADSTSGSTVSSPFARVRTLDSADNEVAEDAQMDAPSGESSEEPSISDPSLSRTDAAQTPRAEAGIWKQVDYGSSDLSQLAIAHRRQYRVSSGRNVGVVEYEDADGSLQTILEVSNRRHVEHSLLRRLRERGVDPSQVRRLYSELEPCTLPIVNCQELILRHLPQAEVTWSFEYGDSAISRSRGMDALDRAVRNIDQYELRFH